MLLKLCLILGIEVHVNVEFVKLLEPPEEQTDDSKSYLSLEGHEWYWHRGTLGAFLSYI